MATMFGEGIKRCIILFGAPGSGKGTQSEKLLNRVHISTGTLLRRKGYDLSTATLIPDEVVNQLVIDGIESVPYDVVLDGYPRTASQATVLTEYLVRTYINTVVIHLDVPDENVLVERILRRGQGRPDDVEPVIRERMEIYRKQTLPALYVLRNHFEVWTVDATANEETVHKYIMRSLNDDSRRVGNTRYKAE